MEDSQPWRKPCGNSAVYASSVGHGMSKGRCCRLGHSSSGFDRRSSNGDRRALTATSEYRFVSHAWGGMFKEVVDGAAEWCNLNGKDQTTTFVWLGEHMTKIAHRLASQCCLCNCQQLRMRSRMITFLQWPPQRLGGSALPGQPSLATPMEARVTQDPLSPALPLASGLWS